MKKRAKQKDGEVNVGFVVQIGISNYDKIKLNAPNLTCVVVEVTKSGKFRLAYEFGVMKILYGMNRISEKSPSKRRDNLLRVPMPRHSKPNKSKLRK